MRMKNGFLVFSGFLGSGKTSMMITLSKELEARGLPAATISNDLGARGFVDTYYSKACGCDATELSGACICYQTENLVDRLRRVLESEGHAVAMSDIPGFGVGALEHVYHKLNERYPNEFTLLPFTAVTDLRCVRQLQTGTGEYPEELLYIFHRQLDEAEVILLNKSDLMDDAGDMYSVLGWAFQRGVGRPEKLYKKSCRVFTACAGAAIYRREVFETIGYFDEMHFAYLEDIDVGYRAKLYGYDNVFCPEAVVYHVGSGTSGSKYNSFKVKLAARNNVYLNYKNMRTWQLLLNSPCLLAGTFVKFLFFKKMGFGKDYVSGFLEGIRTLKNCKRVPSFKGRIQREIGIQLELIAGTAVYVYEFSRRQAAKLGAKV